MADIEVWAPGVDVIGLAQSIFFSFSRYKLSLTFLTGVVNLIRALAGYTIAHSAETAFDTEDFVESKYLESMTKKSGNLPLFLNWYDLTCYISFCDR